MKVWLLVEVANAVTLPAPVLHYLFCTGQQQCGNDESVVFLMSNSVTEEAPEEEDTSSSLVVMQWVPILNGGRVCTCAYTVIGNVGQPLNKVASLSIVFKYWGIYIEIYSAWEAKPFKCNWRHCNVISTLYGMLAKWRPVDTWWCWCFPYFSQNVLSVDMLSQIDSGKTFV